jgi:hypothetical protein
MKNYEQLRLQMVAQLEKARDEQLNYLIDLAAQVAKFSDACEADDAEAMWKAFDEMARMEGPEHPTPEEFLFAQPIFDDSKRGDWFPDDKRELLGILRREFIEA